MGIWDTLCLICGLKPDGGPSMLFRDLDECLDMIIKKLKNRDAAVNMSKHQVRQEIRKVLELFDADRHTPTDYEKAIKDGSISPGPYYPFTYEYGRWDGWEPIAIGIFDENHSYTEVGKGNAVTTHLVSGLWGMGFRTVEEVNGRRRSLELYAVNHTTNLLCLRAPYYYLQAWLDRDSLPPREIAFPHEPEMSFEGELYEIVNSHPDNRLRPSGILYGIPLEGIAATLDQWQDYFSGAFRPKHIIPALNSGLRGNDLIPALLRDFKVWQTCPTDRWVKTDSSPFPPFGMQVLQPSANAGQWQNLPTEVIIEIFSNLSFYRILSLTSSCRYLYYNFGNPSFLSVLLRRFLCLPYSQAYWFLPVPAVKGEVDKFSKACQESMPGVSLPNSQDVSIVFDPDFPLWEFFRANYTSDSMRNRRRLWRICRRFRRWWRHYRGGKWDEGSDDEDDYEEDSSSEESSDDDDDDEEDCSSTEESSDDD